MKVKFWGVRGSLPVPGRKTERYGGNTSCVEVRSDVGDARRHRRRHRPAQARQGDGRRGPRGATDVHLLVSHTHWDHIQGLPVLLAALPEGQPPSRLRAQARRPAPARRVRVADRRPVLPDPVRRGQGRRRLPRAVRRGARSRSPTSRSRARGSTTRASRWRTASTVDGASVVYVTDTAPFSDILIEEEFIAQPPSPGAELPVADRRSSRACATASCACARARTSWSTTRCSRPTTTAQPALRPLAPVGRDARSARRRARRRLALFHHAPERTDAEVDAILAETQAAAKRDGIKLDIVAAYEGLDISLGRG